MICKTCKLDLPENHFEFRRDTGKYRPECRKCGKGYRENLKEKIEEINRLFDEGLKQCSHCHETGKVRGLLCHSYNNGLGNFKDNIESMKKAINYINLNK